MSKPAKERRATSEDDKVYIQALRRRARRKRDRENLITHYSTLAVLFLLLIGSYILALYFHSGAFDK